MISNNQQKEILNGTLVILAFLDSTQNNFGFRLVQLDYCIILYNTPAVKFC